MFGVNAKHIEIIQTTAIVSNCFKCISNSLNHADLLVFEISGLLQSDGFALPRQQNSIRAAPHLDAGQLQQIQIAEQRKKCRPGSVVHLAVEVARRQLVFLDPHRRNHQWTVGFDEVENIFPTMTSTSADGDGDAGTSTNPDIHLVFRPKRGGMASLFRSSSTKLRILVFRARPDDVNHHHLGNADSASAPDPSNPVSAVCSQGANTLELFRLLRGLTMQGM